MKDQSEEGFFSIINETISNDDINFNDFIAIFKVLTKEKLNEEDITINLKETLLDGGYDLKDIEFQYLNKLTDIESEKDDETTSEASKIEEKNIFINSLSQIQNIKTDLIICCLTPITLYFKTNTKINFNIFWDKKMKEMNSYNPITNLSLVYFSDTKVRGLLDSQYMFPNLFKVKHIFQLIISKSEKENNNFNKHLNEYQRCLSFNSFHVAEIKVFQKLSELKKEFDNNLNIFSSNQSSFYMLSENMQILKNFYLDNDKFQNFSCALSHLTYIGNNDSLKRFSSEISFNNNFFIINYDNINDCDELLKIFMELPQEINYYFNYSDISLFEPKNFSSYQRILLIFKPFICRNNLNDILLNIFKVNNFNILTRKKIVLNDTDANYLYHHECPNQSISFNNYYHMMTDSNCEVILLSKFRGFDEAHAILGSNSSVLTSSKGQTNNNFMNIYSLINSEISKLLERNERNNITININNDNKHIERDFLEFSSKINLYFYINNDIKVNEEEINYFCPEFCTIQNVILVCKSYSKRLEDIILSFKYEILDMCYYRFEEYEINKMFKDVYSDIDKDNDYELLKTYFLTHDICLMRIIKPGSIQEFNSILFDEIKFFNSFKLENLDSDNNYSGDKYEFIKHNCFLVTKLEMIEYLYPIINEQINKIEGNILINQETSAEKTTQIINILKDCLKCTVGEEIRKSQEQFTGENDSVIHRFMQFYHQDFIEERKNNERNNYFMNCINEYFNHFCKTIYNRNNGTRVLSRYFAEISDHNKVTTYREILINNYSFLVESMNLGFYEIRIPLMDSFTKQGWSFIESDKFLLFKNYLYPDNNFYLDLANKNQDKNILMYELPFDGLLSNYNYYANAEGTDMNVKNADLGNLENIMTKYLGYNYKYKKENNDNSEEIKNIVRYIIYKAKYESNKLFNTKCIVTDFKKTIVPRNYHYRIEPNRIYMNINRIYEVEEFTGLTFLEMVIQDYMKYRPTELNKTFKDVISGKVLRRQYNYRSGLEEKQFPLTPMLWGRKLNKICKIIEDQKHNLELCDNYGPIVYVPIKDKLSGIIDKGFIKDYEIYLYLNMFEDIKTFMNENDFDIDDINNEYFKNNNMNKNKNLSYNNIEAKELYEAEEIIEKKLYEIFNSEIFTKTRNNVNNIKLLPNRIEPNNVRINKSLNNKERNESRDLFDSYRNIATIKADYEKTYHDIFKSSEINDKVDFGIINKNIHLTDIFCYNGMKYHMFAAFYYLINIVYKKINRRTELISIYLDKSNKNYIETNEEYDIILDSIIHGFLSRSYINYKEYNDSNRYNAYRIEYFFYCLSEIKHYINEIKYFDEKISKIDNAIQSKFRGRFDNGLYDEYNEVIKNDYEQYCELKNIRDSMSKLRIDNINAINIIYGELITCPLQQSEEELNDYKDIYAPKERYYIPMYMNEKWERDLDNDKYKRLERVDKFLLNKLDELKDEREREIFTNTGYELANDYILIEKNLLREPDPPISDKILLERKKNDKTKLKNKIFTKLLDSKINLGKKNVDSTNTINTINSKNTINNKNNNIINTLNQNFLSDNKSKESLFKKFLDKNILNLNSNKKIENKNK